MIMRPKTTLATLKREFWAAAVMIGCATIVGRCTGPVIRPGGNVAPAISGVGPDGKMIDARPIDVKPVE